MSPTAILNPARDVGQRWRDRRPAWARLSDFRPADHDVVLIPDDATARAYVVTNHYSGSYPAALLRFGLYRRGQLAGVAVLSAGTNRKTLTSVFPEEEPYVTSMELGRFVLDTDVERNGESWFWARCREEAARLGVRGVVAFSDPVARTAADGRTVFPGHLGTIYQASNADWLGRATARTLLLLPNGQALEPRMLQKVRAGERGWRAGEEMLVQWGATPRRPTQDRPEWLSAALGEIGVRRLRHGGNYRYAFTLGVRRRAVLIGLPVPHWTDPETGEEMRYPKRRDAQQLPLLQAG